MYTIATLGSHSALQILKGAKDEGFRTLVVTLKKADRFYRAFPFIDEFITLEGWSDYKKAEPELLRKKAILIPHGSFVAYLGKKLNQGFKTAYFGNRKVLDWEENRGKQRKWLETAKINIPREFSAKEKFDRPVIIKFYGAAGGKGYFVAHSQREFKNRIKEHGKRKFIIQEYVIGTPIYIHYFYSPLTRETEIMS